MVKRIASNCRQWQKMVTGSIPKEDMWAERKKRGVIDIGN